MGLPVVIVALKSNSSSLLDGPNDTASFAPEIVVGGVGSEARLTSANDIIAAKAMSKNMTDGFIDYLV